VSAVQGWLIALGIACGALAQWLACQTGRESVWSLLALPLFAAGGLLLFRARREQAQGSQLLASGVVEPLKSPGQSFALVLGVAFLIAALATATAAASCTGAELSLRQLLWYAAALVTVVAAAALFDYSRNLGSSPASLARLDLFLLLCVTAIAAWLRLWHLDRIPPLIWDDEINYLDDAIGLLRGSPVSPFISGAWDAIALHAYSIAAAVRLIPDRAVALRMVSVVPGTLSVPLLYLVLRELFDRPLAVCGSLLLALSSWHILLSRQGYHWAINPFAELVALYWLARGLKTGRWRDFAFSGLGIGLGVLYTYAATFMPLVLIAFGVYLLCVYRDVLRHRLIGFLFLTLVASVVAAPRITVLRAHPNFFAYHRAASLLYSKNPKATEMIGRQLGEILVSFNHRADYNDLFVPHASRPLLDPITAAAFGLGAFCALYSLRDPGWTLMLLTFLVLLIPSAIGVSPTNWAAAWRASGVVPGLFALAAVPFAVLWRFGSRKGSTRLLTSALFTVTFGLVAAVNYWTYFVEHPRKPGWHTGLNAVYTSAAEQVLATPPGVRVLVNHDLLQWPHLRALTYGRRSYESLAWPEQQLLPTLLAEPTRPTVVLASTWREQDDVATGDILMNLLAHYYPDGRETDVSDPDGRPMYSWFRLEPDQIRRAHGLSVQYAQAPGDAASPRTATTTFDWSISPTGSFPFTAVLTGTVVIPTHATYAFSLSGSLPQPLSPQTTVDGRSFTAAPLAPGLHALTIRAEIPSPVSVTLAWSRDGGAAIPVPAARLLAQGLPGWGLVEKQTLADGSSQERWMPVLWFNQPGPTRTSNSLTGIQWDGAVSLTASGSYRFFLYTSVKATVSIDNRLVIAGHPGSEEQQAAIAQLVAGVHHFRVTAEAPVRWQELRFYWNGPDGHIGVMGGPKSGPAD
jgi:Dolichyl-phosphate-mannose-protein mannosyltransferase/PA14 domain